MIFQLFSKNILITKRINKNGDIVIMVFQIYSYKNKI